VALPPPAPHCDGVKWYSGNLVNGALPGLQYWSEASAGLYVVPFGTRVGAHAPAKSAVSLSLLKVGRVQYLG
jgi:hypothetical protein